MERINVSKAFCVEQTNCSFKMKFNAAVDMQEAYEVMEAAVKSIVDENGYYALWLQDLADCRAADRFDIESTLFSDEFNRYIPAMCKAVAEAFPTVEFEAQAYYDDLQCYWVDEFEASFKNRLLTITESFEDDECGYFCPDCGCSVGTVGTIFDEDEITCEDCEEVFKVSDLVFVPATLTKHEYIVG